MALPSRFSSDLAQPARVAEQHARARRERRGRRARGPFLRADREQLGRIAEASRSIELGALEIEPPRLDLREVEDVVDDREERSRRRS